MLKEWFVFFLFFTFRKSANFVRILFADKTCGYLKIRFFNFFKIFCSIINSNFLNLKSFNLSLNSMNFTMLYFLQILLRKLPIIQLPVKLFTLFTLDFC